MPDGVVFDVTVDRKIQKYTRCAWERKEFSFVPRPVGIFLLGIWGQKRNCSIFSLYLVLPFFSLLSKHRVCLNVVQILLPFFFYQRTTGINLSSAFYLLCRERKKDFLFYSNHKRGKQNCAIAEYLIHGKFSIEY